MTHYSPYSSRARRSHRPPLWPKLLGALIVLTLVVAGAVALQMAGVKVSFTRVGTEDPPTGATAVATTAGGAPAGGTPVGGAAAGTPQGGGRRDPADGRRVPQRRFAGRFPRACRLAGRGTAGQRTRSARGGAGLRRSLERQRL